MKTYTMNDIARFWSYVNIREPDECWEWISGTANGYGSFGFDGRQIGAHRFVYWITTGIHPDELCVCHSCDNSMCCNPKHLWLGTQKDNVQDACEKGRMGKLSDDDVRELRSKYKTGQWTQRQLAKEYGVDQALVSMIITRRSRFHVL